MAVSFSRFCWYGLHRESLCSSYKLFPHSSRMSLGRQRRSSQAETSLTPIPISSQTTTILSVCHTGCHCSTMLRSFAGSYDHFCFFHNINNSTKKTDDFAFFIFFTFKSAYIFRLSRLTYLLADSSEVGSVFCWLMVLVKSSMPSHSILSIYRMKASLALGTISTNTHRVMLSPLAFCFLLGSQSLFLQFPPLHCWLRASSIFLCYVTSGAI